MTSLEAALLFAAAAHAGQRDKGGHPYILHPLRVMLALLPHGETAAMAGVLHDVVEDTLVTVGELRTAFGDELADVVAIVTKRADEEDGPDAYARFIGRVASSGNRLAIRVKLADLDDNMDLTRLGHAPTARDHARVRKYAAACDVLRGALEGGTHP